MTEPAPDSYHFISCCITSFDRLDGKLRQQLLPLLLLLLWSHITRYRGFETRVEIPLCLLPFNWPAHAALNCQQCLSFRFARCVLNRLTSSSKLHASLSGWQHPITQLAMSSFDACCFSCQFDGLLTAQFTRHVPCIAAHGLTLAACC
jgi:hypothetical protein